MNVTLGTVNYAAPEQLMGSALDGRADQYALAATAYHLLTGAPMFGSSNPAVVISRHLNSPPPLLADTHPALTALDPVMARALSKKPDNRFRTCTDFAHALGQAAASRRPAPAAPPAMPPPPRVEHPTAVLTNALPAEPPPVAVIPRPPSRWPWAVAGIALLLILSALVFALWPRHQESTPSAATITSTTRPFSTTSSTVPGAVTFDAMRDLVTSFYSQLPEDPMAAWAKLDAHYQNRNGMLDFLGFWSSIQSVTLLSVSPRDSTSVVARLRYVRRDGGVDTEDRWLSVVPKDGTLLIYDSERIGAA